MDAKLNQSDLISLLAKENSISVAKAEFFTKNFFDLIIEGLEQDGIVKINGFGTFKITDVASRGSVNVNTGEKIEIKGHRKLTFLPADALKDNVNQPFAMFEPVEVDETYQPDAANDVETDDTVDVAADENVEPVEEKLQSVANEPVTVEEVAEEGVGNAVETVEKVEVVETVDDTAAPEEDNAVSAAAPVEEMTAEVCREETDAEAALPEEEKTVAEPLAVAVQERPTEPVMVHIPKKKSTEEKQTTPRGKRKGVWSIVPLLIIALAVVFILVNRMEKDNAIVADSNDANIVNTPASVSGSSTGSKAPEFVAGTAKSDSDVTLPVAVEEKTVAEEKSVGIDNIENTTTANVAADEPQVPGEYVFVMVDELASASLKSITLADTLLYIADGELAQHTVAHDETLTKIAKQYFGDKKLWPYIVKYNNISKPDDLCRGMLISIPRLMPRR